MKETSSLLIKRIVSQHQKPTDQTNHHQAALVFTGIKLMDVQCKNCNHKWEAREGYDVGYFREVAGVVILDCPICSKTHRIPRVQF